MKRTFILVSAVIMQLCLGATYSWSVYVAPLRELAGLSQGQAQLPFSLFYLVFPATVVISGAWLLPRFGPRTCAIAGGAIFGGGWVLASFGATNFVLTILGIGLVAGIGAGVAYLVPIAVGIQWFPAHKGLVTGIAVAGFGGGAALVSFLGGHLIAERGQTPFEVFGSLGLAFLALIVLSGLNMQNAPHRQAAEVPRLRLAAIIARKDFRILYLAMFTGLAAGFATNANLKEFYTGQNITIGVMGVSVFAVANALGRIVWGWIIDRISSSLAIQLDLLLQAVVIAAAPWLVNSSAGFLAVAFLVGFHYGGVLVVYAAAVARIWGQDHMAQVYGLLFSANILAAISPVLAGACFDAFGDFGVAVGILAAMMLGAALLVGRNAAVLDAPGRS